MNKKEAAAYLKQWYPILGRLRMAGIYVRAFDPGIQGKYKGHDISLDSNALDFVIGLLRVSQQIEDEAAAHFYKLSTKADVKFWNRLKRLPDSYQRFIRHVSRGTAEEFSTADLYMYLRHFASSCRACQSNCVAARQRLLRGGFLKRVGDNFRLSDEAKELLFNS